MKRGTRSLNWNMDKRNILPNSKRSPRACTRNLLNHFVSCKRSQMQLSFGMIFSVILIIVFIAFAFYVIKSFLNVGDEAQISKFTNKFQQDVDKIWKAELASQELEYFLPGKISAVCFVNDEFENLIFESSGYIRGRNIKHIDVEKTLKGEDKFCVYVSDGKIKIILKKDFGENLVTIE